MNRRRLLVLATAAIVVVGFVAVILRVTGTPALVISGGDVNLSFSVMPRLGGPPFTWREVGCWAPGIQGTLPSSVNVPSLTWTAPRNMGGVPQDCQIEATVSNRIVPRLTFTARHTQRVGPEPAQVSLLPAILTLDPAVGMETEDSVEVSWSHNGTNADHFDIYKGVNAGPMSFLTALPASCLPNCMYRDPAAPLGDGGSATYQVDAIGPGATAGSNRRGTMTPGPTISVSGLSAPTMLLASFSCSASPCFSWVDNSGQETGYRIFLQEKDAAGNLIPTYTTVATVPANTTHTDAFTVPCPVCQNEAPRNRRLKVVAIRGVNESSRGASGVLADLH